MEASFNTKPTIQRFAGVFILEAAIHVRSPSPPSACPARAATPWAALTGATDDARGRTPYESMRSLTLPCLALSDCVGCSCHRTTRWAGTRIRGASAVYKEACSPSSLSSPVGPQPTIRLRSPRRWFFVRHEMFEPPAFCPELTRSARTAPRPMWPQKAEGSDSSGDRAASPRELHLALFGGEASSTDGETIWLVELESFVETIELRSRDQRHGRRGAR